MKLMYRARARAQATPHPVAQAPAPQSWTRTLHLKTLTPKDLLQGHALVLFWPNSFPQSWAAGVFAVSGLDF